MPYSYTLSTVVPASPTEIYRAWLDSVAHSEMTGGEATMSDQVGADVSAWDGYITGRNLELVPGERIVQSWRTTEFDDEFEDSIVTIVLQETEDGTLLTLQHSNVPDEHKSYEEGGWQSNYFEPMIVYFGGPEEEDLVEPEPNGVSDLDGFERVWRIQQYATHGLAVEIDLVQPHVLHVGLLVPGMARGLVVLDLPGLQALAQ